MSTLKFKLFVFVALFVVLAAPVASVGAMAAPVAGGPVVLSVGNGAALTLPVATESFSIDAANLLSTAASIFNALWPIFGILVGIILGIGLVTLIVSEIRKAI
jgi:hypothetical protein